MREGMRLMLNNLMEAEVSKQIGAEKYARTDERNNHRNGTRERPLETRLGSMEIEIPKLKRGSYFPSFLEPRRMWEKAITNVIQEAYINGVSTRKIDNLVKSLGIDGIDKTQTLMVLEEIG